MTLAWRRLACTMLAAALAGCATTVPAPGESGDTLSGRLSVRVDGQPERAVNAGFEIAGSATQGQMLLSGPLGTTLARASWSPGRAVLRSAGAETAYADLDALAVATLGEAIPMAALFDWLRGRAWAGAPASARADAVPGFTQLGWQIDLARWSEGWVEARRAAPPAITVRARLEPAA